MIHRGIYELLSTLGRSNLPPQSDLTFLAVTRISFGCSLKYSSMDRVCLPSNSPLHVLARLKGGFPIIWAGFERCSDPSDTWHLIRSLVITPRLGTITTDNMAPVAKRWRGVNQLCQHHSVADKPQMKTSRIPQACGGERMWSQGFSFHWTTIEISARNRDS